MPCEPDSYSLNITFVGMCLLVPDERSPGTLRVLMPETPSEGCDCHVTYLYAPVANTRNVCRWLTSDSQRWRIDNGDLSFAGDGDCCLEIPKDVLRIGGDADLDCVDDPDLPDLDARVTLRSGRLSTAMRGGCWEIDRGKQRPFANAVTWTACVNERPLRIQVPALDETPEHEITLHPHDGELNIAIYHVTADDLPKLNGDRSDAATKEREPEIDEMPMHIHYYHRALQNGAHIPDLRFQSENACLTAAEVENNRQARCLLSSSSFSCMLAAANPIR